MVSGRRLEGVWKAFGKRLEPNFFGAQFLRQIFLGSTFFGVNIFWVTIFLGHKFLDQNFWGHILLFFSGSQSQSDGQTPIKQSLT